MKKEQPLKSAYELAMQRLAAKDKEQGVEEHAPLSPDQKEKITAARQDAHAKLAEIEILRRKDLLAAGGDPEKLAELDRKNKIDRERIDARLESTIAQIRASGPTKRTKS